MQQEDNATLSRQGLDWKKPMLVCYEDNGTMSRLGLDRKKPILVCQEDRTQGIERVQLDFDLEIELE